MNPSTPMKPPVITPPKCPNAPRKKKVLSSNIKIEGNIIPSILFDDINNKAIKDASTSSYTPNK